MNRKVLHFLLMVSILVLATACIGRARVGPTQTDSETVELGEAETARVDVRMGVGEVNLSGGAGALLEAEFTYNIEDWKPDVDYRVSGSEGRLSIEQPEGGFDLDSIPDDDNVVYRWDLVLNDDIPMDLGIHLGVGDSDLDLSGLTLTSLDVQVGVGKATIDLGGDWDRDFDVDIKGGVGSTLVRLPRDVGVRVETQSGLGSLDVHGLIRNGDIYTNEAYDDAEVVLDMKVQGGVGKIELELAE